MGLGHDLHRVCYQFTAGQAILHAGVIHGNTVADSDSIELKGHTAALAHAVLNRSGQFREVHMAGDDFGKAVDDTDKRLFHIGRRTAQGAQQ